MQILEVSDFKWQSACISTWKEQARPWDLAAEKANKVLTFLQQKDSRVAVHAVLVVGYVQFISDYWLASCKADLVLL